MQKTCLSDDEIQFSPFILSVLYLFDIIHLEVEHRYRNPQLQVGEKYSCLHNLGPNI